MKQVSLILISLLFSMGSYAQTLTVSGTVTEKASGAPAIGVSVIVEGTTNGAITDIDGKYSISNVSSKASLRFSYLGMKEQIVTVNNRTIINVSLEEESKGLQEIVVVGYGTQKVKDLTAPIAVVKGSELSKQVSANAAQALQGKVAGVQVINGGAPGAGATIKIRGVGSLGDNTAKPLYIVDGIFVENIDFLSANDIDNMNVLKDASASAIYGVRAANGVVLITTKRGISGKPIISYDGYVGIQTPVNEMPMISDKNQYVELVNKANQNIPGYVMKDANNYPVSTDWYDELLRNAFIQNHSLDVSGATETTNYSFGVNYFYQNGIMDIDNNYNRYNLRGRIEQKVNSWLKLGVNTIVSNYKKVSAREDAFGQAYVNPPVYPVYDNNNTEAYPLKFASPQLYGFGPSYGNPVARAYYYDDQMKGRKYIFSIFADFNIIDQKLNFRTSYNSDYASEITKLYYPENHVGGTQVLKESSLTETFQNKNMQIFDNILTYTDKIDKHNYSVLLGQSTRMERQDKLWGVVSNVPGDDEKAKYLKTGSTNNRKADDDPYQYNGLSFFTRGTYNYNNKYMATATFRADASSKYQQKWGFFPSFGVGWILTEEDFLNDQKAFDYLKLRLSWGMLGNDNIPGNSSLITGTHGIPSSGVFGDRLVDGVGAQTVYKNYLKWEVVSEYNLGFDYAALGNRLTGEIDGYYRTTDNVVFEAPVASGGGTANLLANNGKILNAGIEFTVKWEEKTNDKFSYNIGLNLTTIHNEVLELKDKEYITGAHINSSFYATRTAVGHPIGSYYGYQVIGVYQSESEAALDPVSQPVRSKGFFRFKDNGDNVVNEKDMEYLGSPIPWLIGGLNVGLNYDNFDFGLTFYGQVGNKIFNAKRLNRGNFSDGNYDLDFYENHWDGKGSSNTYPSPEAYNQSAVQNSNSFFVEDGSYLRIQNVQLGYTFNKIKQLSNLRVYVSADRPYTFFGYNGFTPEVSGTPTATGIDNNVYPMQAIYSLGMKVNF